ncbi:MAG: tetratricopeptide repeat protein [Treponema sp.]|jgi:tetratricopeptide (TPR) repeat protein|nr:tetratricopeptide repeat protein [Treponema sp.]
MEEDRIVFLEVPESLRGQIQASPHHLHEQSPEGDEFSIDPAIPVPVELPPGAGKLNLEELSWEMILSGMIKLVAGARAGKTGIRPGWIDYYRRFVLTVKPEIQRELTEAAILLAKNGNFDMALEIFTGLGGLFPESPSVMLNRALVLEDRARTRERTGRETADAEKAELWQAWETVLALDPPFANGLFNAGFFYLKERDFRRARQCFTHYIPLADDPDKKEEAESILGEIIEKALDDESFQEAWECILARKEQEGLDLVRDFLERYPHAGNGWFLLGWALRRLERWEDGLASLRKALELGGGEGCAANAADLRNELAICLMELGDLPGARKELEAALRADPENIKIISNLGVLALKTGSRDEAAGFFRTVLELAPDDPLAREYCTRG